MSAPGFSEGPAVSPASALLAWLEGEGAGRTVRVPVVVVPSPLGLASGYIAASVEVPESEGLAVRLDDSTLGVSLADRLRDDCAYDVPCAIWVEGVWGSPLGMPDFGGPLSMGPKRHPLTVRDYAGKVEGAAARVWVK